MAQLSADIEAASPGKHDIENGQLEIAAGGLNQTMLAISTCLDGVTFPCQTLGQEKSEIAFVFNKKDSRAYEVTSFISASAGTSSGWAGR